MAGAVHRAVHCSGSGPMAGCDLDTERAPAEARLVGGAMIDGASDHGGFDKTSRAKSPL